MKNLDIVCRRAEKSDIETVTDLLYELFNEDTYEELLAENKTIFANKKEEFFLAYDNDTPVGVCHFALREEYVNGKAYDMTAGYLEAIYIKSAYRLRGIATALVAACEEWASQNGCREFLSDCLSKNTESYNFHLKLGFEETERCIFFRKEIAPVKKANDITVRSLKESDLKYILAQFAEQGHVKPDGMWENYFKEQESGERFVILAEVGGEIAGYVTLFPKVKDAMPFRGTDMPEIKDFHVFIKFQRRGIGSALMNQIEEIASGIADTVCLGVGVHSGYGAAQRMYVKRGYVFDGSGVWDGSVPAKQYGMVENGDDLVLYMSKKLR